MQQPSQTSNAYVMTFSVLVASAAARIGRNNIGTTSPLSSKLQYLSHFWLTFCETFNPTNFPQLAEQFGGREKNRNSEYVQHTPPTILFIIFIIYLSFLSTEMKANNATMWRLVSGVNFLLHTLLIYTVDEWLQWIRLSCCVSTVLFYYIRVNFPYSIMHEVWAHSYSLFLFKTHSSVLGCSGFTLFDSLP